MSPLTGADAIRRLAHLHDVQLSYTAQGGRRVRPTTEVLVAVLNALGCPVNGESDARDLLPAMIAQRHERMLEPVIVASRDGSLSSGLGPARDADPTTAWLTVAKEDGSSEHLRLADALVGGSLDLNRLELASGYHQLQLEVAGATDHALLIVAPGARQPVGRGFGVSQPLYALRGPSDWGVGSYTELTGLLEYVGATGGELVGTLPLFATYLDPPVDPSPYLPVSRLFWNEIFVDVEALPELGGSPAARALVESADFRRDLARLRAAPLVEHGEVMARKRRVLELCAEQICQGATARREEFEAYVGGRPDVIEYARFRAAGEATGSRWPQWGLPAGTLPDLPDAEPAVRYHLYAQFVAETQLAGASAAGRDAGAGLYLDLPVGVHPAGFDTWSAPQTFAPATVGAPPDSIFSGGQAWGFPPMHPQRIREDGYRYVIDSFRRILAHARAVRIDHVLGLQRLYWIPDGAGAESGAYVGYRTEELRAIVRVEAERAGAVVVGEDLGTVSPKIRHAMDRDGMLHTYVSQLAATAADPLPQPRMPSVASFTTHDLPRFAAFWRGSDIADRLARGLIDRDQADAETADRQGVVRAIARRTVGEPSPADSVHRLDSDAVARRALKGCLGSLADGPAHYVLIDLADLELEEEPDNRPGTGPEADNWRRRLPRPLDAITADPDVGGVFADIAERRLASSAPGSSR